MASFQVILGVNMGREHPEKPVVNFKPDIQGVTIDLSFANQKFVLVQPRWQDELYLENFPLGYLLEIVDNKLMKTLADYLILFFLKICFFNISFTALLSIEPNPIHCHFCTVLVLGPDISEIVASELRTERIF